MDNVKHSLNLDMIKSNVFDIKCMFSFGRLNLSQSVINLRLN